MKMPRPRARPFVITLAAPATIGALGWCGAARAQAERSAGSTAPAPSTQAAPSTQPEASARAEATPDGLRSEPAPHEHAGDDAPHRLRVGAIGGLGFPPAPPLR